MTRPRAREVRECANALTGRVIDQPQISGDLAKSHCQHADKASATAGAQ